MTPYKGIIRIRCFKKKGDCIRVVGQNVRPSCIDCPDASTQILDLDGKVIYEYRHARRSLGEGGSPAVKTGKRKK